MHRLFMDLETGGTEPLVNPILTLYFRLLDENFRFMDELELKLKPDDLTKYTVEQEALDVNHINLEEHLNDPTTLTYSQALPVILEFLKTHKIDGKRQSYRIHGQNVAFDINFLKFQLIPAVEWKKYLHHTVRDTYFITEFLKEIGLLPEEVGNLGSLVEYYDIPKEEAHNARGDILMTVAVYRKMIDSMSVIKTNALKGISDSILSVIEGR